MNGGPNPLKHVSSSQGCNDTLPQSEGKPGPPEEKKRFNLNYSRFNSKEIIYLCDSLYKLRFF